MPHDHSQVDWYMDFYYPFLKRWAERVHSVVSSDKMLFVEPIPNEVLLFLLPVSALNISDFLVQFCPSSWKEHQIPNMVFAPHW